MRVRTMSLVGVFYLAAATAPAQDVPGEPSVVKVYRVADLVARHAVRESGVLTRVTPQEWVGEHPQTIASLHNLAKLIETIVPSDSGAVAAHEDSLSLVVRHSAAGQVQIAELLEQLRVEERPVVELTLIPIQGIEGGSQSRLLTDEQMNRLSELLMKKILSREETEEVVEIGRPAPNSEFALLKTAPIRLANGRKAPFVSAWMMSMTATAVLMPEGDEFLIRIDNVADDIDKSGNMPIQCQSFSIPTDHSALFITHCDGASLCWLVTPKRIDLERQVSSVSDAADR